MEEEHEGWTRASGQWLPDWMYYDETTPHLGGYAIGGDPGSFHPAMWEWLLERYSIGSVIDVGCGEGHSLRWFREHGCKVRGVEGVPQEDKDIVQHDYTLGPYRPRRRFDLCWCCEFVEHVEERYMANFFATFKTSKMLLITHAVPGQGGHHHVHCKPPEFWIERLDEIGFKFDKRLTAKTRQLAPHGYYNQTGLAFIA